MRQRDRIHDYARDQEPGTCHQKWRNRFNRKSDSKISRTPNQIERSESYDDPDSCRRGHEAMTICHSRDRATIRLLRMKYQSRRDAPVARPKRPRLHPSPENQSIEQKQNHCAHDRHDPTSDVILAGEKTTDPSADEGAGDTEQNRDDATAGIFPRHQQFRDGADDKADNQCPNNRVSSEVHMGSESD